MLRHSVLLTKEQQELPTSTAVLMTRTAACQRGQKELQQLTWIEQLCKAIQQQCPQHTQEMAWGSLCPSVHTPPSPGEMLLSVIATYSTTTISYYVLLTYDHGNSARSLPLLLSKEHLTLQFRRDETYR